MRASTACASGWTQTGCAARELTTDDIVAAIQAQNIQVAAGAPRRRAGAARAQKSNCRSIPRAARLLPNNSVRSSSSAATTGPSSTWRDVGAHRTGAKDYNVLPTWTANPPRRLPSSNRLAPTRWRPPTRSGRHDEELAKVVSQKVWNTRSFTTRPAFVEQSIEAVIHTLC